jgi:FkbM family methyltransferase
MQRMFLTAIYARLIYSIFKFLTLLRYSLKKQPRFSLLETPEINGTITKDGTATIVVKFTEYAGKAFKMMVGFINIDTILHYTIGVKYEGLNLLIRPFLIEDIIVATGQWEREIKNVIYSEIRCEDVVVDVGAYIGDNALPLAKLAHRVIAFEPHPQTSKILEKNIKLNQIHNIEVIKKPVADAKKKITFDLSYHPMLSGIALSGLSEKDRSTIEAETIDLDTALVRENRIDWLLIDSEGYEVSVLNGARNILRKHSPKILIEIQPQNYNTVKKILMDEGYDSMKKIGVVAYYSSK